MLQSSGFLKLIRIGLVFLAIHHLSCSGKAVKPLPTPPPEPPSYVYVPHPPGTTLSDLATLWSSERAPQRASLEACGKPLDEIRSKTRLRDEIRLATRELVRKEPVHYHWCFYSQALSLEEKLKDTQFLDERQALVLDYYSRLTPLARAFYAEYNDTRYLRVAVSRYRQLSEWVFYRSVEPMPEMTQELVGGVARFPTRPSLEPSTEKTEPGAQEASGLGHVDRVPAQEVPVPTAPAIDDGLGDALSAFEGGEPPVDKLTDPKAPSQP